HQQHRHTARREAPAHWRYKTREAATDSALGRCDKTSGQDVTTVSTGILMKSDVQVIGHDFQQKLSLDSENGVQNCWMSTKGIAQDKQHKAWREAQEHVPHGLARHAVEATQYNCNARICWRLQEREAQQFWRFQRRDTEQVYMQNILRESTEFPTLRSILKS
ncbi:hypothetical protein HAX54_041803, partial [Datura stramonium]|nr:hypothetical protein [Datura stramonium]